MEQLKHGLSKTRMYRIWSSMMTRCYNQNAKSFKFYGARGIKVCSNWHKFINFYNDMKNGYSDELTLDRYPDKTGNYELKNCRWANEKQQACNRTNNKTIVYKGKEMCISEVADLVGLDKYLLYDRITRLKWVIEKAIEIPKILNHGGNKTNRKNNFDITFNGLTMNVTDWARKIGVSNRTMQYRIDNWPLEKALTEPKITTYAGRIKK